MYETPTFEFDDSGDDLPRNSHGRLLGDERLHVTFYKAAVESAELSKKEGRKIFEDHDFIRIAIPGDQHNQINTFATDDYKRRFPIDYKRFVEKAGDGVVGTPINLMPGLSPSMIAELKAMNVRTVEDLAELSDSTRIMGVQDLKRKAKAFLDISRAEAIATKSEETNNRIKEQELKLAQREAELDVLKKQVEALQEVQKKKKKEE